MSEAYHGKYSFKRDEFPWKMFTFERYEQNASILDCLENDANMLKTGNTMCCIVQRGETIPIYSTDRYLHDVFAARALLNYRPISGMKKLRETGTVSTTQSSWKNF